ncbi:MAG TPA: molybdopterin-dependent oxidoreductase [candidate division Zixibacteria bacterium]|nr:molybdopterin-dependent oxidoreductase [candidate division Zixibacteria bacterium]
MARLKLELEGLAPKDSTLPAVTDFRSSRVRRDPWDWDRVVKGSHLTNCWYQQACNFNLYVKDGVVLREEQAANYPPQNDPRVPDFNPRGCQKGACYVHRMYDPTRIKFPLKRVGKRGEGKWKRISWDEALTEVADAIIDTAVKEGPEAIVQCGGTRVSNVGSEGTGPNAFFIALGAPLSNVTADNGDDHQGVAITLGKVIVGDSADNWFYSDMILIWGGNPVYTNMPNYHFIAEARYNGTRVVTISPDYSPSAVHADLWVPVNIGSDAALALAMSQVILKEKLYREDFVREQTDMPLLVNEATGRYLREKDLKSGGREDVFYFWDRASGRLAEAPRKSLALDGLVPALEGSFQVATLHGTATVKPVMEVLRAHLDRNYTPEQAATITGVSARMIEELAREIAAARGVVNISTANWGKFYHGDLIERAILLVFALCGHMGRKGATFSAFPMMGLDTSIGGLEKRGDQIILSAAGGDPRFAQWREEGFTDEMILYEYVHQAFASGGITPTSLMYYIHGGVLDFCAEHPEWDPHLKRPIKEYVREAFDKKWQFLSPGPQTAPRVMFALGGNFLRRSRATNLLIEKFLPKLRLLISIDWRWNATAMYADLVLPACSWYEKTSTFLMGMPVQPFVHVVNQATPPLYDSMSEWKMFCLLARKIEERAAERGVEGYKSASGAEFRFAGLEDRVTFGGLYNEDDEEGIARDAFLNASNVEQMDWEEFKERGIAAYTGVGTGMRSIGNTCDIVPGETVVPLTWHTERKDPYPTLTRRIQFLIDHEWFRELGEDLPVHKDPPAAGGDYPLKITGGHHRWSIHSDQIDESLLLQLQRGGPLIFLSAKDARARGIEDGDTVEVANDVASFRVQAGVSPAVRPGQVIIYHAWENYQFDGWRHFKSVMPSPMNPIELAGDYFQIRPITMSNYPGFSDRGTRVEVRKV